MPRLKTTPRARLAGALALVAVAFLAAFAFRLRQTGEEAPEAPSTPQAPIELDRFAARMEKSTDDEQLTVSVRLRANVARTIDCFVFVVARSERSSSKLWAIWPTDSPGMAISAGGHFHAAHPASGHPLSLGSAWEPVEAVLPHVAGRPPFDSVVVYVVSGRGDVLLARPFAL